ncbi:hypothetical protein H2248_012541 [Termitomyces sp. 'cryptogamus']|nr:hypothetical protein H2248_012541 [Termitomyces sp. 'cryptogamus']
MRTGPAQEELDQSVHGQESFEPHYSPLYDSDYGRDHGCENHAIPSSDIAAAQLNLGSQVAVLSVASNFEESGPVSDDFELENDETGVAAHAQSQAILNVFNDNQDVPYADMEEEEEMSPEAQIESICIAQEYIHPIQNATLDKDKLDTETLH